MSFLNQNMNEVIDVHNFVFHTGWTFFLSFCQFEGIKVINIHSSVKNEDVANIMIIIIIDQGWWVI